MYTPSDKRLEWPEVGLLFESGLNAQGALLKSCLGPWQDMAPTRRLSGRLEQLYLPSDSKLDLSGERPLFELDFNE